MMKKYLLFLVMAFVLLFNSFNASGQTPIIESFSPLNGDVGSTVVLSGSGFSTIASNNVVFFGTTKANVLTSPAPTSTAISVVVPSLAKDDYISVTNTASGKQGKSRVAFVTSNSTIANTSSIFPFNNSQSFSSVTLATGNGWGDPTNDNNLEVGDLDLDGKPDIVKGGTNGIGIYRNTSIVGVLSASSFTSALTLSPTNTGVRNIAIADVDNDGKLDVLSLGTSVVSIYRNTTITAGTITFAAKVDISVSGFQLRVADMNNDGMLDIIIGGGYNVGNSIKVYKNLTTNNGIAFDSPHLVIGSYFRRLDVGDMNNDGKVDIVAYNENNGGIKIFLNQTSNNSLSFNTPVTISSGVYGPEVFDLNRDGLNDITGDDNTLVSTSSMVTSSSFTTITNSSNEFFAFVEVGDLTGDGYPEIVRASASSDYSYAKYRLNALASTNTFSNPVNVPNSYYLGGEDGAKPKIIDFDGDGKKDIIFATGATGASAVIDQSTFLIYRNTIGEPVDFYPDAVSYSGLYLNYLHTTNYWKTAAGVSSSQSFSSSDCILNVNASGGNAYQGSSDAPWSLSSTFKFYNSFYLNIGYYPLYHSGPNQNYSSSAYIKFTSSGTYGRPVQDSPVLFPIGRATYNPITITNNTGSIDDYKILINDAVYKTGTNGTLALNSIQREWIVTKTNANTAGTGTTLKFDWSNSTSAVNGTVTTPALFIYNTTTAKWEKFTTGVTTSGNTLTVTGYTGILNGTKFAIGDNTTGFPYETITTSGTLTAFQRCSPNVSATQNFTVSGTSLQANISISAPSGMQISSNGGTSWATSLSLTQTSGTVSSTTISVRMASNSTVTSGSIALTSTGATAVNLPIAGTTVSAIPVLSNASGYTCGAGAVVLSASATNSPTAYAFYSLSSGGTLLSSTNTYTTPNISSTTTYWVEASNACGTTNPRVEITASVYAAPAITAESLTTQTICQNFSSTALSVTATGQGLSYQWYSNSSPSNSGGAPISGATASSYSPSTSALGTNYYYVVVSGICGPVATSNVSGAFSVNGPLAGTIAVPSGASVCTGSTKQLVLSGHSGSIQWQESSSLGGTYTDISGATSPTFTTAALNSNTYYRAKLSSGSCTPVYTAAQLISVDPLSVAGTISGSSGVCSGSTSILTLSGHTGTIVWTNATQLNGTYNSVGVPTPSYTTSAITTTQYYKAQVTSGTCPAVTTSAYTVSTTPLGTIGNITGSSTVTLGGTSTYSVPAVTNATSYLWNLPSGTSLASNGPNGSSVTINIDNNFTGGTLTVQANGCGSSSIKTRQLSPISTAPTLTISSSTQGAPYFCGSAAATLTSSTTSPTAQATFEWILPVGVSVASGSSLTGSSINIEFASTFNSGSVTLKRISATETLTASYTVSSLLASVSIQGPSTLCSLTTATYEVAAVPTATSYEWLLPTGMTGTSSTNSISTTLSGTVSGSVQVRAVKAGCGVSAWRALTVGALATPGSISGPATICGASSNTITTSGATTTVFGNTATYSISAVSGATSYTWSVSGTGMTISSGQGTSEIVVTYTLASFTSGVITVVANGTSGCVSATRTLQVYRSLATISGPTNVCGMSTASYSINAPANSTVTWTLPSWMTPAANFTATSNPITVNIASGASVQALTASFSTSCGTMSVSTNVGCSLFTQIQQSQCGGTIANSSTVANATWLGDGTYRFHVSGGTLGATVILDKSWNGFQFGDVTGALPGTYSVKVDFKPTGASNFVGYGATCSLILDGQIPTTALASTQCGTTIANPNTTVNCTWVGPGTYRFVVSGGTLGSAVTVDKTWNGFQFGDVTGALPGAYSVAVSFKPTGYTSFGTATTCSSITLGTSIPTTAIASAQCGTTIASTNTTVNCTWVGPGTYRFVVSGGNLGAAVTVDKTSNGFQFSDVTGALPGAYSVAVSFKPNGQAAFGNATTCNSITLDANIPTTAIVSIQCGATIASSNTVVNSTWVGPGTYRFVVSGGNLGAAVTVDKTWNGFQFADVTGALPGTYSVAVSFKPNGQAAFGNATTCNSITLGTSIPTTAIVSTQCGTTIANTNTTVNCTWVGPGTYRFVVSGGSLSAAVTVDKTWNGFQFADVTGALPGTYSVAVSYKPNGQAASFGAATTCNSITLGTSVPTTAIASAQCGTTIANTITTVNCTWVGPGTYRFVVSGGNLSAAVTVDKTWNGFQFADVTGALPGTYSVAVSFKPNGQAAFGNATTCNSITLGESIPTTAIATTQCTNGVTSTSTVVNCAWVGPGTYKFEISGGTLTPGSVVTLNQSWNGFTFANVPGAGFGGYDVTVSFRPTGYTTFGDPMSCEGLELINSGSLAQQDPQLHEESVEGLGVEENTSVNGIEETQFEPENKVWSATAASNPFEHSFKVNLNGAEAIESAAMFTATLTDMSGKVYTTLTLSKEALTEEYFGQDLAPGMYMLILHQGEELRVLRVVKR